MGKKKNEKTITLTNGDIENMMFNPAFKQAVKQSFPVKTAYWLGRALDKVTQNYKPYQKAVNEIVEKYAEKEMIEKKERVKKKADGQPVWGENEEKATADLEDLKAIEVDLGIRPIKLDLDACEKMRLTPSPESLAVIMPLLEDIDV